LDSQSHNIQDSEAALHLLHQTRKQGQILTGLFYLDKKLPDLVSTLNLGKKPASQLNATETRPSSSALEEMLAPFR
jgi:hypothetical protein